MNYYEELGVSQQATEQEIRKAHRRLVKLMHPDAQPDKALKMVAETQMRRLNSIVSTLVDPEQRSLYDAQLREAEAPKRQGSALAAWQGIPWWLASAVGAVVLSLVAVWLWADHLSNTFGKKETVYVSPIPAEAHPVPVQKAPTPTPAESGASLNRPSDHGGVSATVVSDPPPAPAKTTPAVPEKKSISSETKSQPTIVSTNIAPPVPTPIAPPPTLPDARKQMPSPIVVPQNSKAVKDSRKAVLKEVNLPPSQPEAKPKRIFSPPAGTLIARAAPVRQNGSQIPMPPGLGAQTGHDYLSSPLPGSPLPAAPLPKTSDVPAGLSSSGADSGASIGTRDSLEGEWVYAPKEPERKRAGFYPPEYIDLKIFGSGDPGSLKGQYSAKYVVTDRPVSPEVSFQLAATNKGSRKFLWQSNDGARGTLSIDPIDEKTIRIDWHTTSATRGPALTSGQATLVRRQ